MSKAKAPESPTPGPSPVGRGVVCLAACPLVHYIYNKV